MEIKIEKKNEAKPTPSLLRDVSLGEVFSLVDWPSEKFLRCETHVIGLDDYETVWYSDFPEWFHDAAYDSMDYDEQDYFDGTFDERKVVIYESKLILTVDK